MFARLEFTVGNK